MKTIKRIIAFVLALNMLVSTPCAYADGIVRGILGSIGGAISQAAEDTSQWASQAIDDTTAWASQTWDDTSAWASQTWDDTSSWALQALSSAGDWALYAVGEISSWTKQAWDNSSKWVMKAWDSTSTWTSENWSNFIIWINTITSDNPYSWIDDSIIKNGLFAYESFAALRAFLDNTPDINETRQKYDEVLTELSLLNNDKEILWLMLKEWSDDQNIPFQTTAELALPFLTRLLIEGETVIGENIEFSGPIVGQYLVTILETLNMHSSSDADKQINNLRLVLEALVRPNIIGDNTQNELITDDHYFIEQFSYLNGKYQLILIATKKDTTSQYPLFHGSRIDETIEKYFKNAELGEELVRNLVNGEPALTSTFNCSISGIPLSGVATIVWSDENEYLIFSLTDQELINTEYEEWLNSIAISSPKSISFEVDMESDGSFYGVNQSAQKYTINRIFDEEKFMVPMTGHGWSAERGNNLIDNIKGVIKGSHSTVIGDNNAKDGADRVTTFSDGSRLLIQTKYYSTASRSIAACFKDGHFRYIDHVEGKPMAIEVPADQYDAALEYMKNRIANGEVEGVTDVNSAVDIVKKGNLTYQQAKHIAKAGTVESVLYDSAHACVIAGTSMGISAAVGFAINIWNGENIESAIKESIFQGLKTGGTSFIISVLSSQAAKSGLNTAMIPASRVITHALGPKVSAVIVNAFRPAGSAIYGAAAMQSAAKLLRGNVITSTATFVVLSVGDVADIIRGRISWTQLAKNVSTTAAGVTGGALGYLGGAALGTAILPGAGTVVGIIVSVAAGWGANEGAKAVADIIAEDDADKMIHIIEEKFSEIALEYFLSEEEVEESITNLQVLITPEMLKQMYQYQDHDAFARQLIEMAIDPVVEKREHIYLPSEDQYSDYLTIILEEIYEDINVE